MKIKLRWHDVALLWKTILARVIRPRVGRGPFGLETPLNRASFEQPLRAVHDGQNAPLQTNRVVSGKRSPALLGC